MPTPILYLCLFTVFNLVSVWTASMSDFWSEYLIMLCCFKIDEMEGQCMDYCQSKRWENWCWSLKKFAKSYKMHKHIGYLLWFDFIIFYYFLTLLALHVIFRPTISYRQKSITFAVKLFCFARMLTLSWHWDSRMELPPAGPHQHP